jgi:hypothetical protein
MHLTKYTQGWTRRHFLEQVSKGVFAAGVLSPLMDVIGRNGNCEAAYPPELLSIEAYTRGELKAGDVLSTENVDIVHKTCSTRAPIGRSSMMAGWST